MMFSFVTFSIEDASISKNLDLNLVFPSNSEATEGNDYSWNISQVRKDMRIKEEGSRDCRVSKDCWCWKCAKE